MSEINYTEIVQNIETQLNALASEAGAAFSFEIEIISNIREYQAVRVYKNDKPIMRGAFIPSPGDIVPIQGLYSFTAGANLIFACTDEFREQMFDILNNWAVAQTGTGGSITVDNGTLFYLLSTNTPNVGSEQLISGIGQGVSMGVILGFQFIKNGVIGNSSVWKLDGEPLIDLLSTVEKTRNINTDARENDQTLTAVVCSQSLDFRFTIPYITTDKIKALVQEFLSKENMATVHQLTYYDGGAITEENAVTYNVIMQGMSLKHQKGTVSTIDVVFTIVQEE